MIEILMSQDSFCFLGQNFGFLTGQCMVLNLFLLIRQPVDELKKLLYNKFDGFITVFNSSILSDEGSPLFVWLDHCNFFFFWYLNMTSHERKVHRSFPYFYDFSLFATTLVYLIYFDWM